MESNITVAFSGILIIFASSQSEGRFWEDPYLWVFYGILIAILKFYLIQRTKCQEVQLATSPTAINANTLLGDKRTQKPI